MLTLDDLKRFAAVSGHCLTVYEPLRHDGARAGGDLPRVRKTGSPGSAAIREVEQILADNGWDEASRHDTLRSLRKAGGGFPSSTSISEKGSVIVFRARDFSHATFWPETLAPRIHFGSQFLVLPLLPAIANDRCFWILTLSAKGPHLFRGSPEKLIEVRLPYNVPKSPADTDGFFGPGSSSDAGLSNFFRGIDRGIRPVLMNERYPLLLAGVTQELSLYGGVNTYAPILEQAIHGCPEHLTREALHARAAALIAAYAAGAPDKALRDRDDAAARDLLATDVEEIRESAELGRVEHLMLAFPTFSSAMHLEEESLNSATLATIRHAGMVSVLHPARLPSGVAAILRFRDHLPVPREEALFREDGR